MAARLLARRHKGRRDGTKGASLMLTPQDLQDQAAERRAASEGALAQEAKEQAFKDIVADAVLQGDVDGVLVALVLFTDCDEDFSV